MNRNALTGFIFCTPFILLAFLSGLKIGGVIGWSWWWITAVVWVPGVLIVFWALVIFLVFAAFHDLMNKRI